MIIIICLLVTSFILTTLITINRFILSFWEITKTLYKLLGPVPRVSIKHLIFKYKSVCFYIYVYMYILYYIIFLFVRLPYLAELRAYSCLCIQGLLLDELRGPYLMLGMKSRLATYKLNLLHPKLLLQPRSVYFFLICTYLLYYQVRF